MCKYKLQLKRFKKRWEEKREMVVLGQRPGREYLENDIEYLVAWKDCDQVGIGELYTKVDMLGGVRVIAKMIPGELSGYFPGANKDMLEIKWPNHVDMVLGILKGNKISSEFPKVNFSEMTEHDNRYSIMTPLARRTNEI